MIFHYDFSKRKSVHCKIQLFSYRANCKIGLQYRWKLAQVLMC